MNYLTEFIKWITSILKSYRTGVNSGGGIPPTPNIPQVTQTAPINPVVKPLTEVTAVVQTVTPVVVPAKATEGLGYFINPDQTPLDKIDFQKLKDNGITEVYIRVTNSGDAGIGYNDPLLKKTGSLLDKLGIKKFVWVWANQDSHFSYVKNMAKLGWNILADVETYTMSKVIPILKEYRADSKGKTFIACVKADGWDGGMLYDQLVKVVDYIMPMLYLGDYNKTVADLVAFVKKWDKIYPNRFMAALETYKSDNSVIPKTKAVLTSEIKAVIPYTVGVGMFQYGRDNFMTVTPTPPKPTTGWVLTGYYTADKQDTNYTCADSSMQMMLSALGYVATEAYLATLAGTTTSGTGHPGIHTAVTKVAPKIKQSEITLSEVGGWTGIAKALNTSCEFILHIMTGGLSYDYQGNRVWQGDYGHYIFLTGVNVDKELVRVYDPIYGDKIFTFQQMSAAMSAISQKSWLQFCQ